MLKIYGSMQCPGCVQCREELDNAGVEYEFCDITQNLALLKEFLVIRDGSALFDDARKTGMAGIPCIITEDGSITFDWDVYVGQAEA